MIGWGFDGFENLKQQARTSPFPPVDFKLRLQPESYLSPLTLTREGGGGGGSLSSTVNALNVNGNIELE